MMLPEPIRLAKEHSYLVFGKPYDANLIVLRGPGKPDEFDGLITLSWVERDDGPWKTMSAPCATRPGTHYLANPMHPLGTAVIPPGQHRGSHARGLHHKGQPNQSQAWVQVGKIVVPRDNDRDLVLDPPPEMVGSGDGLNIHRIDDPKYLAGCIGVGTPDLSDMLAAFDWLNGRFRQPTVSLTLIGPTA